MAKMITIFVQVITKILKEEQQDLIDQGCVIMFFFNLLIVSDGVGGTGSVWSDKSIRSRGIFFLFMKTFYLCRMTLSRL